MRNKIINTLLPIYRKIIPVSIREIKWEYLYKLTDILLKQKILKFLKWNYRDFEDGEQVYCFLKKHSLPFFPYDFIFKYKQNDVKIYADNDSGMKYVIYENKKMFFKAEWDNLKIKKYYTSILAEQDIESPHRYESIDFRVNTGDVVVDAGAAEGNFALSVVERAKRLYLFEADKDWIKALEKTFEPWKEKVVIINKYVSNTSGENSIRLDDYFAGDRIDFLKADVEGAELDLLAGMENMLLPPPPPIALNWRFVHITSRTTQKR
jgi:hypothetical protein